MRTYRCVRNYLTTAVLAGIEFTHMIRKGQFAIDDATATSFADRFYALVGEIRPALRRIMLGTEKSVSR